MVRWMPTLVAGLLALAACSREPRVIVHDASGAPPPAPKFPGPVAALHGRVLDESGVALEGVRVRLGPGGSAWSATPPPEGVLEGSTDGEGRFRFDVPVPDATEAWLEVEPDPFHAIATIQLGADARKSDPRLFPGTNMLADVQLAATGAIAGCVRGTEGAPIAGAWVWSNVSTTTSEDGSFQLGHLVPGRVALRITAPGFIQHRLDVDVAESGRVHPIADVQLAPIPVITGVVVDRDGLPVPHVVVHAARQRDPGSRRRTGVSGSDGRFSIELAANAPHAISTVARAGFLEWNAIRADGNVHEPGRGDVRIVLDRARPVEFAVVDAKTGAPLADYTIDVWEDARCGWRVDGSASWQRVPPDGIAKLLIGSEPAKVRVQAPDARNYADAQFVGYLPFHGPFEFDSGSVERMTVWLERGGSIRMRLSPASSNFSALVIARRSGVASTDDAEYRAIPASTGSQDSGFEMAILGLPSGTFDVTITKKDRAQRVLTGVSVVAGETVDLGDVALEAGAVAAIRLVLPKDVSPVGLGLRLDDGPVERLTSKRGRRTFSNLAAGEHVVTLLADPPRVPVERTLRFTIAAGEVREFRFDVREP